MTMSGKYYPNNWEAIQAAPEEYFEPCTWEDFETWKLSGWDLPSSVACVIRAHNKDTGKVYEHTYRQAKRAKQRRLNTWTQMINTRSLYVTMILFTY